MPRSQRTSPVSFTVPGLDPADAAMAAEMLQDRLNALTDLSLTLKHIHWNVVGPHFIAVHTMLDPQVAATRAMAAASERERPSSMRWRTRSTASVRRVCENGLSR